ncbi:MAG: peptidyl-prolyl cis-trans isomerase C [Rhodothermales bacterium]|jgi:peptidyl-prolyl cis-trans isomerase C
MYRFLILTALLPCFANSAPPAPPPLPPFANTADPTEKSVNSVLAFLPEILATFGDKQTITKTEVINDMGSGLAISIRQGRSYSEDDLRKIVGEMVDAMINRKSMLASAEAAGYRADSTAARANIDAMRAQLGEKQFTGMLEFQGLTVDALVQRQSQKQMIDQWLDKEIKPTIKVPEEDIIDHYGNNQAQFNRPEEIRAAHVLLKCDMSADAVSKAKAEADLRDLHAKVKAGANFAEIAKSHSACPSSARGGDLGYFSRGKMVPAFEKEAFSLEVGGVSSVFQTQFGYHILKVTDRKAGGLRPLDDELRAEISNTLTQQRVGAVIMARHEEWKADNKVEILVK